MNEQHLMPSSLTQEQFNDYYLPWEPVSKIWKINKSQIDNVVRKYKISKRYFTPKNLVQEMVCYPVSELVAATARREDHWPGDVKGFIHKKDTREKRKSGTPMIDMTEPENVATSPRQPVDLEALREQVGVASAILVEQVQIKLDEMEGEKSSGNSRAIFAFLVVAAFVVIGHWVITSANENSDAIAKEILRIHTEVAKQSVMHKEAMAEKSYRIEQLKKEVEAFGIGEERHKVLLNKIEELSKLKSFQKNMPFEEFSGGDIVEENDPNGFLVK